VAATVAGVQGWEFAVVAAVIVLLVGGSRLPKLARSLGQARREMDKVRSELTGDAADATEAAADTPAPADARAAPDPSPAAFPAPPIPAADAPTATAPLPPPLPPPGSAR
jgi:sec-independent protein translocase protein TatA